MEEFRVHQDQQPLERLEEIYLRFLCYEFRMLPIPLGEGHFDFLNFLLLLLHLE